MSKKKKIQVPKPRKVIGISIEVKQDNFWLRLMVNKDTQKREPYLITNSPDEAFNSYMDKAEKYGFKIDNVLLLKYFKFKK